jgi:hypothetical protein
MISQKAGMDSDVTDKLPAGDYDCGQTVKGSDAGETEGDSSLPF